MASLVIQDTFQPYYAGRERVTGKLSAKLTPQAPGAREAVSKPRSTSPEANAPLPTVRKSKH